MIDPSLRPKSKTLTRTTLLGESRGVSTPVEKALDNRLPLFSSEAWVHERRFGRNSQGLPRFACPSNVPGGKWQHGCSDLVQSQSLSRFQRPFRHIQARAWHQEALPGRLRKALEPQETCALVCFEELARGLTARCFGFTQSFSGSVIKFRQDLSTESCNRSLHGSSCSLGPVIPGSHAESHARHEAAQPSHGKRLHASETHVPTKDLANPNSESGGAK